MKNKKYGEFKCPHCEKIFFKKKQLDGHIGGAHRSGVVAKTGKTTCKHCGVLLTPKKNWPEWAYNQKNLCCKKCLNTLARINYRKRQQLKRESKQV